MDKITGTKMRGVVGILAGNKKVVAQSSNTPMYQQIQNALKVRGTIILGFDYHGKKRNVVLGAKVQPACEKRGVQITGQGNWTTGNKEMRGSLIFRNNREYIQAFPTFNPEGASKSPIKIFALDKIENLTGV